MKTLSGFAAQKRVMCLGIVLCMVVPGLLGMVVGSKTQDDEIYGMWDLEIGPGVTFEISEYTPSPITGELGIYHMDGNVIVDGGTLIIRNAALDFIQDVNHRYVFEVKNGGTLLMSNATVMTDVRQLEPYIQFGMYVNDSVMKLADHSVIAFPGNLQIRNTETYLNDSWITGLMPSDAAVDYEAPGWLDDFEWTPILRDEGFRYALGNYYGSLVSADEDVVDDGPVLRFYSCDHVTIADSRIDMIYEQWTGGYSSTLMNTIYPNSQDAWDNSGEPLTALEDNTDNDTYTLSAYPITMGINGFATNTLPNWPILAVELHMWYNCPDYIYTNNDPLVYNQPLNWSTNEGVLNVSAFIPREDANDTFVSVNLFSQGVDTLDELRFLDVSYKNCDDDGDANDEFNIDQLILVVTQVDPNPPTAIVADDSELSIINSHVGVDYLNPILNEGEDNRLRLTGGSHAYMYNMTVAEDDDGNNVVDWLEYDNDPVNPFEVFNGSEIYYYRWMEVPVVDTNGIPVRGANITASGDYLNAAAKNFMNEMNDLTAGASPENNASDNRTLAYLNAQGSRNIDDTNYTMTDGNGRTTLPLVTDVITSASLPSSQKMGKYRFMAAYDNGTEWHFMNVTHSFSWFPDISAENNVDALVYPDGTPMLVLDELSVPLPDLVPISVAFSNPTPDENAPITITVTIRNNGTNAALDFSVLVEDIHLGTHTTLWTERYSSLGAGSTAVLNVPWIAEPSGQHYILVTVDADEEVFEGIVNSTEELNNDNDPGAPIYVTPFMPELTVATSDTFITPISNTSAFGTILTYNATVHNTGSANITDVPVYFYWGNLSWGGPDWNGDDILDLNASSHLIGTVEVDIDYGDIYTTGVQYTPGQDGTYRMYVWVDPYNAIDELVEEYSNNLAVSQNYIVRPKPNLSIVEGDIAVADTTPTQGVATTITAVVRNLGGAPATGTFDVVISLDDASNVIGTQPVTNLAAYGSQLVTVGWLPDSPGFHTIYVDVDPTSAIPESSESDNQAFLENVAVYNVSLDLIVNNANSPYYIDGAVGRRGFVLVEEEGNLVVNGSLAILLTTLQPFHIRVKDQGTLTLNSASLVSANPSTPFYLEDDATLNVFGGTIDSNINIVASGSNVQVNLEDATISGNFDTTSGASVTMLAEDTTFAKALDDVRGDSRYDLIAVSTPSIRTYDSSEVYIYRKLTITVYDGQLITPYPVDGAAVDLSYALLDPAVAAMVHESGVTGPDGTVTFNAMSDIVTPNVYPSSFFVGNYVLETTFTHGAYTTWENDTVMLSPYPTLTSVANYPDKEVYMSGVLPDLDPPIYVTPSNPGRGEEVTITTTVENIGVTDAHDVLIRFMDETTGEVIADRLATVILAGSTYVPVPAVTWTFDTLGNHTVSVEVDPFDQITEFPNGDNYNSTVITVRGLADLAFPYIYDMYYSPAPYVMGHEMTINAIVHNDGDLAAPFYNVTFYSSTPSTAATRIGNVNVTTGLAAGQVATASIVWTPLNATSYNITAVIDGDDFIEETSETNNQVVGTVDVMEYSDLYISDLTFSADSPAENNTAVTVTARVHNLGGAPASYVVVNFYDGPVATSNFIDTDTITYLPSGIAGDAQVTWDATCAGRETLHHITAVAVEDIYEDEPGLSNQLVENFTVVDTRPDLTLNETDIIVLTDNIVMMKGFAMNVTVHNVGPSQAENVTVDLFDGDAFLDNISEYLANVTVWNFTIVKRDIGAILNVSRIGAGSVDVIAANSSATSSIACKGLTSNGTHELFAVVDGGWNVDTAYGWVDEFDEDDNSASISVNVSLPVYSINIISPATGAQIRPGEELFVAGEVLNTALGTVAGGIELTITLSQGGVTIGQTTMTSGSDGVFNGGLSIPANARGQMTLTISSANAEDTEVAVQVVLPASETPLWLYIVIIVIVVVAVVGGFTAYTYFVGIGKLVECGSCGAFIPEGAHKCPKCGVEFEVETAKCSACSAWIPIDAKKCPECGAEFTTGDEEGEAYEIKMRTQYDEMVGKIKEGAKKTLGQKMTDQQFQTWWATQPSHITYEEWLREEEEMRKSGSKPCPQCTTPNSVSGRVCHKCGTPLKPDAPKGKMPKEAPAPAAAPTTVPAPSTAPKETKKCPNCNMQVDVKEAVCPVCGNDFGRKEPEAPKSMPETPAPQQPTPQPVQQPGEQPRPVVKKVVRTPVPMQRVVVKKPGEEEKKEGQQ